MCMEPDVPVGVQRVDVAVVPGGQPLETGQRGAAAAVVRTTIARVGQHELDARLNCRELKALLAAGNGR